MFHRPLGCSPVKMINRSVLPGACLGSTHSVDHDWASGLANCGGANWAIGVSAGSVAVEQIVQFAVQVDELALAAGRDDLEGAQQEPGQRGQRCLEVRLAER